MHIKRDKIIVYIKRDTWDGTVYLYKKVVEHMLEPIGGIVVMITLVGLCGYDTFKRIKDNK